MAIRINRPRRREIYAKMALPMDPVNELLDAEEDDLNEALEGVATKADIQMLSQQMTEMERRMELRLEARSQASEGRYDRRMLALFIGLVALAALAVTLVVVLS